MTRKIIKIIIVAAISLLAVTGCKKENMNIIGTWNSVVTLKNDMATQDDPYVTAAAVYVKQTNSFTFNDDGTFTRFVSQKVDRAESFMEEVSVEKIMEAYAKSNSELTIKGTYKLNGSKITLNNDTVSFNEKEFSYADYYNQNTALGPVSVKINLTLTPENELVIQEIKFKKAE